MIWKAVVFGLIGYAFVSSPVPTPRLIFGALVAICVAGTTEFFWFYLQNAKKHRKLVLEHGEAYLSKLEDKIIDGGIASLIRTRWLDTAMDD